MNLDMIEQVFPANVEEVPVVVEHVSGLAELAGVHPKRIMHLELAVEEAVMNICSYAYEKPPARNRSGFNEDDRLTVQLMMKGFHSTPVPGRARHHSCAGRQEDWRTGGLTDSPGNG
jgi:hypothetical protein